MDRLLFSFNNINPKETAHPCPNCGELNWSSDLRYLSVKKYGNGFVSTLYNVCKKCSERHKK